MGLAIGIQRVANVFYIRCPHRGARIAAHCWEHAIGMPDQFETVQSEANDLGARHSVLTSVPLAAAKARCSAITI